MRVGYCMRTDICTVCVCVRIYMGIVSWLYLTYMYNINVLSHLRANLFSTMTYVKYTLYKPIR